MSICFSNWEDRRMDGTCPQKGVEFPRNVPVVLINDIIEVNICICELRRVNNKFIDSRGVALD
jgi:hypothetical protein